MSKIPYAQLLQHSDHRPFPLPDRQWLLYQEWKQVLFVHVPVPVQVVQELLPSSLVPDLFGRSAWLSFVVFTVTNSRLRLVPFFPVCPTFQELNLRTYVTYKGKPGIYFIDIRSNNPAAIMLLRTFTSLHYRNVSIEAENGYYSVDVHNQSNNHFTIRYHNEWMVTRRSQIEEWLTERYCCYTIDGNRLFSYDIHHMPWKLSRATIEKAEGRYKLGQWQLTERDFSIVHYVVQQQVLIWNRTLLADNAMVPAAAEQQPVDKIHV